MSDQHGDEKEDTPSIASAGTVNEIPPADHPPADPGPPFPPGRRVNATPVYPQEGEHPQVNIATLRRGNDSSSYSESRRAAEGQSASVHRSGTTIITASVLSRQMPPLIHSMPQPPHREAADGAEITTAMPLSGRQNEITSISPTAVRKNEKRKLSLIADVASIAAETTIQFFVPSKNFDILSRVVLLASVADITLNSLRLKRSVPLNTSLGVNCCCFVLALVSLHVEMRKLAVPPALNRSKDPLHWIFFTTVIGVFAIHYFVQFSQCL